MRMATTPLIEDLYFAAALQPADPLRDVPLAPALVLLATIANAS